LSKINLTSPKYKIRSSFDAGHAKLDLSVPFSSSMGARATSAGTGNGESDPASSSYGHANPWKNWWVETEYRKRKCNRVFENKVLPSFFFTSFD
jgi:hypothetical protein